jgi:hypothetical protein
MWGCRQINRRAGDEKSPSHPKCPSYLDLTTSWRLVLGLAVCKLDAATRGS